MSELSYEELKAKLAELQQHVQAAPGGSPAFKVSAKGGVSLYGLGRFPVTLYYEQWIKLFDQIAQLRSFLEANKGALKLKHAKQDLC